MVTPKWGHGGPKCLQIGVWWPQMGSCGPKSAPSVPMGGMVGGGGWWPQESPDGDMMTPNGDVVALSVVRWERGDPKRGVVTPNAGGVPKWGVMTPSEGVVSPGDPKLRVVTPGDPTWGLVTPNGGW